jgi:hypothetical protein
MQNGDGEYSAKFALLNPVAWFLTGQWLAHAKLSLVERAYLAADLHVGKALLVRPTMLDSAGLLRVSPAYAHAALRRPNDRLLVESGAVPLALPAARKALPAPVSPQARLADIVSEVGVSNALGMLAAIENNSAVY